MLKEKNKEIFFMIVIISLIAGLAYFIIKIRTIPQKKIIPYNLQYAPRIDAKSK